MKKENTQCLNINYLRSILLIWALIFGCGGWVNASPQCVILFSSDKSEMTQKPSHESDPHKFKETLKKVKDLDTIATEESSSPSKPKNSLQKALLGEMLLRFVGLFKVSLFKSWEFATLEYFLNHNSANGELINFDRVKIFKRKKISVIDKDGQIVTGRLIEIQNISSQLNLVLKLENGQVATLDQLLIDTPIAISRMIHPISSKLIFREDFIQNILENYFNRPLTSKELNQLDPRVLLPFTKSILFLMRNAFIEENPNVREKSLKSILRALIFRNEVMILSKILDRYKDSIDLLLLPQLFIYTSKSGSIGMFNLFARDLKSTFDYTAGSGIKLQQMIINSIKYFESPQLLLIFLNHLGRNIYSSSTLILKILETLYKEDKPSWVDTNGNLISYEILRHSYEKSNFSILETRVTTSEVMDHDLKKNLLIILKTNDSNLLKFIFENDNFFRNKNNQQKLTLILSNPHIVLYLLESLRSDSRIKSPIELISYALDLIPVLSPTYILSLFYNNSSRSLLQNTRIETEELTQKQKNDFFDPSRTYDKNQVLELLSIILNSGGVEALSYCFLHDPLFKTHFFHMTKRNNDMHLVDKNPDQVFTEFVSDFSRLLKYYGSEKMDAFYIQGFNRDLNILTSREVSTSTSKNTFAIVKVGDLSDGGHAIYIRPVNQIHSNEDRVSKVTYLKKIGETSDITVGPNDPLVIFQLPR